MRDIKFRAYYTENGKGQMINDITVLCNNHPSSIRFSGDDIAINPNNKSCHIMQYTGLKDKNGKEIYEGDIVLEWRTEFNEQKLKHEPVRPGSEKWVVKYNNGGYYPFAVAFWECTEDAEHCEVIGNIWENPELMEE